MRCQRRADLGGRRGLGATRMTIIALVVLRTAYAALIGAVLGVVVMGGIITGRMDALPPVDFVIGVGILSGYRSLSVNPSTRRICGTPRSRWSTTDAIIETG